MKVFKMVEMDCVCVCVKSLFKMYLGPPPKSRFFILSIHYILIFKVHLILRAVKTFVQEQNGSTSYHPQV